MPDKVLVWEEKISIPTYPAGKPEKNPMFLEKRVYQGSSGVVFPHPVIEKISGQKQDQLYKAVFLENAYIKIMLLPELGGRVQMAYDKVKQRHFIYYNQVIKPALVGLTGPWISGGIEFNWPQHHRPSTFEPVDYTIKENKDGSKTVWINEVERMTRTKGMAAFTLYPGKAYLEISGKLYNRTPFSQTFLWWANPAVKATDDYQSVFPPDVHAVFDHGRRDVSSFPIAKGVYYKVDYAPGTDISRYKNIPVPTSYMAVASKYNFIGGYEHGAKAGMLHVADHHISPGKKQWTWGNGEFGKSWDKNLTDEDGPYIELMTGMYTDNQPDFSWLQPFEEKTFVQYFMPYRDVGMIKNASKEAVLNIEWQDQQADIKIYFTSTYDRLKISVFENAKEIFSEETSGSPYSPYLKKAGFQHHIDPGQCRISVIDCATGRPLISYQPEKYSTASDPSPAKAPGKPEEIATNELLYLTGLHIEQIRHASYNASDYYREALSRDENDIRNNNALGKWWMRRGKFEQGVFYFRKAISGLTIRNPNPYNGEPYYNLGWALKMLGNDEEAYDAFYKSIWNEAWQHAGFLNLARLAVSKKVYDDALSFIDKSLIKNYHSHTARHLKVVILRKLGKAAEAMQLIGESLDIDPFNYGCLFEKAILEEKTAGRGDAARNQLLERSRNWVHHFIEYAFDYAHAGLFEEAIHLLSFHAEEDENPYPMKYYYLGWFASQLQDMNRAAGYFSQAASAKADYCFSNRIEDVPVLQKAIGFNPSDSKAFYYLGNFWYDKRQYADAIDCWEQSVRADNSFPTVKRNLSLAYYNKLNDPAKALVSLEEAFSLDEADARILMELDQLRKKLGRPAALRLFILEEYLPLVESRDDLYLERITLYNQAGEYEKAKKLLNDHLFHPWEGGEGKVVNQYLICHTELAKQAIIQSEFKRALNLLEDAQNYPSNLGEGKLINSQENDIYYLKGLACELSGQSAMAESLYKNATKGISEPVQVVYYNDPQPDKIFYQGLAWKKLGCQAKADEIFEKLINFGSLHQQDKISVDYFAVSLPDLLVFDDDLDARNRIHCLYLMGLGQLGLGHYPAAEKYFLEIGNADLNHQGAKIHLKLMEYLKTDWALNPHTP